MPSSLASQLKGYLKHAPQLAHANASLTADLLPILARAEAQAAGARSQQEIRNVERLGQQHRDTTFEFNPEAEQALGALTNEIGQLGRTRIGAELENQAFVDLQRGGELSPEDARNAEQQARSAFAARGLANSRPAVAAEVLNRQALTDQRRNQRRAFASGVEGIDQQRQAGERAFANQAFVTTFSALDPFTRVHGAYSKAGGSLAPSTTALFNSGEAFISGAQSLAASRDAQRDSLAFSREQLAQQAQLAEQSNDLQQLLQSRDLDFQRDKLSQERELFLRQIAANKSAAIAGAGIGAAGSVAGGLIAF